MLFSYLNFFHKTEGVLSCPWKMDQIFPFLTHPALCFDSMIKYHQLSSNKIVDENSSLSSNLISSYYNLYHIFFMRFVFLDVVLYTLHTLQDYSLGVSLVKLRWFDSNRKYVYFNSLSSEPKFVSFEIFRKCLNFLD